MNASQRILLVLTVSLGLIACPSAGSCTTLSELFHQEFKPELEIDLAGQGFERARVRLGEGDVAGCRREIIAYFFTNEPKASLSIWPAPINALERAEQFLNNEYWLGLHRSYVLGENIAWSENPDELRNWNFLLNAFDFMRNVNEAYRITHDERYLIRSKEVILDFIRDNLDEKRLPSRYAWFDHSVAYRSIYFVDFWNHYVKWSERDELFGSVFIDFLWRQAKYLACDEFYSAVTNHGVFSDIALLRIALAFPEFRESGDWITLAAQRIERQMQDNFTPDGVHQEYAPAYQILTTKLLYRFIEDARAAGSGIDFGKLEDRLQEITAYIPYIFHPDGMISLLGDTYLESAEQSLDSLLTRNPSVRYVYSNGEEGCVPQDASKAFPDGQIYVMRSGWGEAHPYGEESYLIADYGPFGNAHQHFDFMTFELSARGARWITDLGPFTYTPGPERDYILSGIAHNTVVPYVKHRAKEREAIAEKHQRRLKIAEWKLKRLVGRYDPEQQIAEYEALLQEYADVIEDELRILLAMSYQQIDGGEEQAKAHLIKIINKGPSNAHYKVANEMYATLGVIDIGERQQDLSANGIKNNGEDTSGQSIKDASFFMPIETLDNTLLTSISVDALKDRKPEVDCWISETDYDYLEGRFQYTPFFEHARAILFIKPHCFLILDRVTTKRECIVKKFFHMPPAVKARRSGEDCILSLGDSLRCIIKEISVPPYRVSRIIEGSNNGEHQGWYGGIYNTFEPAPVLEIIVPTKEGYLSFAHLIVPVGRDAAGEYTVHVKNGDSWNPVDNVPLELTIEEPGYRTNIHYLPSEVFRFSKSEQASDRPEIRVIRAEL